MPTDRDTLGKMVWDAMMCHPKWDALPEVRREHCRRIGQALYDLGRAEAVEDVCAHCEECGGRGTTNPYFDKLIPCGACSRIRARAAPREVKP